MARHVHGLRATYGGADIAVDVLATDGGWALIDIVRGRLGWVGANYLSAVPNAIKHDSPQPVTDGPTNVGLPTNQFWADMMSSGSP